MSDRTLFVKWVLLNALTVVAFLALGQSFGGKVHGASLVAIPAILASFAYASTIGGKICWDAHSYFMNGRETPVKTSLLHRAQYLMFWAYICQMLGILSTVAGFWILLSQGGTSSDLGARIQNGGGVALLGTFVGVLASLILSAQHRLIEHNIGE